MKQKVPENIRLSRKENIDEKTREENEMTPLLLSRQRITRSMRFASLTQVAYFVGNTNTLKMLYSIAI
jgi:hypothetical protein